VDGRAAELAKAWGFKPTEELQGGHCSHVFADETRVLKIPFQGEELTSGFHATLSLSGTVGAIVHRGDPASGSILMERLRPGTKLKDSSLTDEEQVAIAAGFARTVRDFATSHCLPLADYTDPKDRLVAHLLETSGPACFLHGDLHQENILLHGPDWKLIDPKGLMGDPAYEPAAFLRNPVHAIHLMPDLPNLFQARISQFSKTLDLDPWRICAWSLTDIRSFKDEKWEVVVRVLEALEMSFRP
jgi:streptomycin 6-kinase